MCIDTELEPRGGSGSRHWHCHRCDEDYPEFQVGGRGIAWLFANPRQAQISWRHRRLSAERQIDALRAKLKRGLRDADPHSARAQRLRRLLEGNTAMLDVIARNLGIIELDTLSAAERVKPFADLLPQSQGLLSYRSNLFRDWSWANDEAEIMFAAVERVLARDNRQDLGRTLTLGAGCGRLSYDLHQRYKPERSVLLDMNPLLTVLAARIVGGEQVNVPEFPLAPLSSDEVCRCQPCRLPSGAAPANSDLQLVLGDASKPPFPAASFDTVLTPWLIDILPLPLTAFMRVINRLLPVGGRWLNTGSFAYTTSDPSQQFCPDELYALAADAGFRITELDEQVQPYLGSPLSAHARSELVFTFSAIKVRSANATPHQDAVRAPRWLENPDLPIPLSTSYDVASARHLLNAQVLGAIDGKRTINEIAQLLGQKYEIPMADARAAIEAILQPSSLSD